MGKNISKNCAYSVAQFTNNDDGKSAGPVAEVGESFYIASIIFFQIIQYQLNINQ